MIPSVGNLSNKSALMIVILESQFIYEWRSEGLLNYNKNKNKTSICGDEDLSQGECDVSLNVSLVGVSDPSTACVLISNYQCVHVHGAEMYM